MKEDKIVIGVDCGATHTKVKVWSDGVCVFEEDDLPGANFDLKNESGLIMVLSGLVNSLRKHKGGIWVWGVAGLDNEREVAEAERLIRRVLSASDIEFEKIIVVNDIELVLWAGSDSGFGVGLISGTGSNCVARSKTGKLIKVGGVSHLLSDEGSGYSLGDKCIRVAAKMADERLVKTKLLVEVLKLYKVKDIVGLKNYLLRSENYKMEVARAAKILIHAAKRRESVAYEKVVFEALELVQMVATINRKMKKVYPLPLYIAGSLFSNEYYFGLFERRLKAVFPEQKIFLVKPIDGALKIAQKIPH